MAYSKGFPRPETLGRDLFEVAERFANAQKASQGLKRWDGRDLRNSISSGLLKMLPKARNVGTRPLRPVRDGTGGALKASQG